MEEQWVELLKFQSRYNIIKKRGTEVLNSIDETLTWYENSTAPDKLFLLNKVKNENSINFLFCGINVYIEIKYDGTSGIIASGVITSDKSIEIKNEYYKYIFDAQGNVLNWERTESIGSTHYYREVFIVQLHKIIKVHLEKFNEVNI